MKRAVQFRRRLRQRAGAALRLEALEPRTLFSFSLSALAAFKGKNSGLQPTGLVMDADGDLFGTTARGGTKNYGTIFEIPAGTNTITTLASFTGLNGTYPIGNLVLEPDGTLWGTTTGGGLTNINKGTVFSFQTGSTTSTITTLVSFVGLNGSFPESGLVADAAGNLYGTTLGSVHGTQNHSTLFMIAAGSDAFSILATFKPSNRVIGSVAVDSAGNIFGTTSEGGTKSDGSVYEFPAGSTASTVTTLASFSGGNGLEPTGGILLDPAGNIIGTTGGGGSSSDGTLFRLNATANTITTLANFDNTKGARPVGQLLTDPDGDYFGVTAQGGAHSEGTVFEVFATSHSVTVLISFDTKAKGLHPTGPLIMDGADFLGVTYHGGADNRGVIFELTPKVSAVPPAEPQAAALQIAPPANSAGVNSLALQPQGSAVRVVTESSPLISIALGPLNRTPGGTLDMVDGVTMFDGLTLINPGNYTLQATSGDFDVLTGKFAVS